MNRPRVIGALIAAIVVGALSVPARATERGLSPDSTWTDESCGFAAAAADPSGCTVQKSADPATGAVSGATRLVSPEGGTAPWSAQASSTGMVAANYQLDRTVRRLEFAISLRIDRAHVTVGPGVPGMAGWVVNQFDLGRAAHVTALASALHSSCADCVGGISNIVLRAWKPGTTLTTSGENVVLDMTMVGPPEGIPPGLVTVRAGVAASVWQSNSWGDDSAGVMATVTKIALR